MGREWCIQRIEIGIINLYKKGGVVLYNVMNVNREMEEKESVIMHFLLHEIGKDRIMFVDKYM